ADVYRQIMMNLSYAYFIYFHADPEHPDWAPMFNPVFAQQPNPDTLYVCAPLRGDLTYRVSGNRGTCNSLVFSTLHGVTGDLPEFQDYKNINTFDVKDMDIPLDSEFEILFSAERPKGYTGNWGPILPDTDTMMVRYVSLDWAGERDPQLSIECLDPVAPKARLTPEQIVERIRKMARLPANMDSMFYWQQNDLKQRAGVNKFELQNLMGVEFQYYWPAAFEFSPGEALIVETDLPEVCPYWNLQLNDPYFNAIEYVYRLSSTNAHFARPSSDGKFRAVVSLEDPGVPNWLDTAGFTEGTLWGRWYDCSSTPLPTLKRVPFSKVRDYLPADTPVVTPEQRTEEIRERVRACQRRRRW
ncbi:MAG: hypothetical protein KDE55_21045, partial [Novosphingobium sp.]|nr:hypothetical protein [Novosphingobium sp.]